MANVSRAGSIFLAVVLVAPVFMAPVAAEAQSSSERQGLEMSREEMQLRILRGFENRVMRELELSESEIERIREIVIENRQSRGELARERHELSREMEALARQGGSDAEARTLLARQAEMRARELALQEEEEEQLREVLSPMGLLRYLQMRSDLVDRIRELERRSRSGRGGGSSDPGRQEGA